MRGDAAGQLEEMAHGRALGDDVILDLPRAERRAQRLHLAAEPFALLDLAQRQQDLVRAERLVEIVVGAFTHRRDRGVLGAVGAHHQQNRLATGGAVGTEELQAVHARHAHVGEDDIRLDLRRARQRTPSVSLGRHLVTGLGEQESQRLPETRIVVNYQNAHQPPLPVAGIL